LTCLAILATFRTAEGFTVIKSELVDRISVQNPHLYRQDAEKIVKAIFSEITGAMARGDRVELRGFGAFFCKVPGRPDRTKSSHRGSGFGRKKGRSFLQDWKGHEISVELTCGRGLKSMRVNTPENRHVSGPVFVRWRSSLCFAWFGPILVLVSVY
jgi:nucleoid DNA-binding protein